MLACGPRLCLPLGVAVHLFPKIPGGGGRYRPRRPGSSHRGLLGTPTRHGSGSRAAAFFRDPLSAEERDGGSFPRGGRSTEPREPPLVPASRAPLRVRLAQSPGEAPVLGLAQQCELALPPQRRWVELVVHRCRILRWRSKFVAVSVASGRHGHVGRRTSSRLGLWSYLGSASAERLLEVTCELLGGGGVARQLLDVIGRKVTVARLLLDLLSAPAVKDVRLPPPCQAIATRFLPSPSMANRF